MLTRERSGFLTKSLISQIKFFIKTGGEIQDISIPQFVLDLNLKDVFPKAIIEEN